MPESFRDLLRGLAADGGGASDDLTAGALKRARAIGRRHFAAGAVAIVAGSTLAGMAAATLLGPDYSPAPPVDDPATTESPSDDPTEEVTEDEVETDASDCGRPDPEWAGWGDSGSAMEMDELPEALHVLLGWVPESANSAVFRYTDDGRESVIEAEIAGLVVAPDGNRHVGTMGCESWLERADEEPVDRDYFGVDTQFCSPTWSPDSNRVTMTVPSPEYDEHYLLDVATGEQFDLPDEVGCAPRWSADGEYLVSFDGTVAMRPDGTGRTELTLPETGNDDQLVSGLSSISADLSRACLQVDDAEIATSGHVDPQRCDLYVDTETGAELDLPLDAEGPQVVFLPDGKMIASVQEGDRFTVSLFDADMALIDQRELDLDGATSATLVGYFAD